MMSFLGALLVTGLVVVAIGWVLYAKVRTLNKEGDYTLAKVIWVAFCVAVSILPGAAIESLIMENSGGFGIFKGAFMLLAEPFMEPSLGNFAIVILPLVAGGYVATLRCSVAVFDKDYVLAALISLGVAFAALVGVCIAGGIYTLITEIRRNPDDLLATIAYIVFIVGLCSGGETVIGVFFKD